MGLNVTSLFKLPLSANFSVFLSAKPLYFAKFIFLDIAGVIYYTYRCNIGGESDFFKVFSYAETAKLLLS